MGKKPRHLDAMSRNQRARENPRMRPIKNRFPAWIKWLPRSKGSRKRVVANVSARLHGRIGTTCERAERKEPRRGTPWVGRRRERRNDSSRMAAGTAKDRAARGIKGERRRCAYVCLIAIEYSVWRAHARPRMAGGQGAPGKRVWETRPRQNAGRGPRYVIFPLAPLSRPLLCDSSSTPTSTRLQRKKRRLNHERFRDHRWIQVRRDRRTKRDTKRYELISLL